MNDTMITILNNMGFKFRNMQENKKQNEQPQKAQFISDEQAQQAAKQLEKMNAKKSDTSKFEDRKKLNKK